MPEHFSFIFLKEVEKLKLFNKAANSQKDFLSAIEKKGSTDIQCHENMTIISREDGMF
jgi:hypothetical protein